MIEMNRVSTHKKTKTGVPADGTNYARRTVEGYGMYTFVYGKGSKRVSETKHCSESQAKSYKEYLEKAGA
jgi:hypothetical protein